MEEPVEYVLSFVLSFAVCRFCVVPGVAAVRFVLQSVFCWRHILEKTGCKIICGAPTTLAVKGLMMMMMMETQTAHYCMFYRT